MSNESVQIAKAPKKVQNGMNNLIDVRLRVTQGKVLAMMYALEHSGSSVGNDLRDMLVRAAEEAQVVI